MNFHDCSCLNVQDVCAAYLLVDLYQRVAARIVQNDCTVIFGGARKSECQTCIVELSVVIEDASFEVLCGDPWYSLDCFFGSENACWSKGRFAAQEVVKFQACSVVWEIDPVVDGSDEGERKKE